MSIKAYKGFNPDMTCRDFQYQGGESIGGRWGGYQAGSVVYAQRWRSYRSMIVLIIVILLAVLFASSIESNLREAFSGDWMQFDDSQEPKESNVEMDNSEFDWGHNVKHRMEGDYE